MCVSLQKKSIFEHLHGSTLRPDPREYASVCVCVCVCVCVRLCSTGVVGMGGLRKCQTYLLDGGLKSCGFCVSCYFNDNSRSWFRPLDGRWPSTVCGLSWEAIL